MLTLAFEGWWQCRFATDPDPTDDPRGVSGPTFTVAGEPDFDRIIRLQNPVSPRYPHESDIGVTVRTVTINRKPVTAHPLLGAAVDLHGGAEFTQRNLIYVTAPWIVVVDPFDISISANGIVLRRAALWDVTRPHLRFDDVFLDQATVTPRLNQIAIQSPVVAEATGIMDYAAARTTRLADLRKILADFPATLEDADTQKAGLRKRIAALEADQHLEGARLAAEQFMGMQATYAFPLNGDPQVEDPAQRLRGEVGRSQLWQVAFWLGGYDVDALCGYMSGTLTIPFHPDPGRTGP
jgi:hypothetical protein